MVKLFIFFKGEGGGLDMTCLGFAQIDSEGNVNVSWFSRNLRGPGGFIDITHRTRKIVFCGTLTAGGLKVEVTPRRGKAKPPRVRIVEEGRNRKFISRVEQVNLHGPTAVAKGQRVVVVTERGVFRVREGGLELTEVAPGIDVDRDIRPFIEFDFKVSPDLREMDHALFGEARMNFRPPPKEGRGAGLHA